MSNDKFEICLTMDDDDECTEHRNVFKGARIEGCTWGDLVACFYEAVSPQFPGMDEHEDKFMELVELGTYRPEKR